MDLPRFFTHFSVSFGLLLWLLLGLPLGLLAGCAGGPQAPGLRGGVAVEKSVWVTRFEYRTRSDIDQIMRRCAAAGFRTVMFQVRGNGTVSYASRREIWSEQFGFRAPDFDPLSHALVAAHANGLRLHAWINVMPGWRGSEPPADRRQLFHARPQWFLRTDRGEYAKEGAYVFLNPCLPEVRQYLVDLCVEVAADYRVDGIHLDYIRYPAGQVSERSPGDPRSQQLFTHQTGRPLGDHAAFREWKAGCVTEIVRHVRERLRALPRPVMLTAAVNSNLKRIRQDVLQSWPHWARTGMVDAVFPMNYTSDHALFESRSRACVAAAGPTPVVMGVGVYAHQRDHLNSQTTLRQMNAALRAGAVGVAMFSYGSALKGEWAPAIGKWPRR